jgi:hypothetical protein
MMRVFIFSLALVGCPGLITFNGTVQQRGAYDLKCPEEQVVVREIANSTFEASCNNKKQVYTCARDSHNNPACVPEGIAPAAK